MVEIRRTLIYSNIIFESGFVRAFDNERTEISREKET